MFTRSIFHTTLTEDFAEEIFPSIPRVLFGNDISFTATLRALVYPRMTEEDNISLKIRYPILDPNDEVNSVLSEVSEANIALIGFNNYSLTEAKNIVKRLSDELGKKTDYVEIEDLKMFISEQSAMGFYINEEKRQAIVIADKIDNRIYHYIQSVISRLLPWYFKEHPLDDDERELAKSLIKKTSTEYERLIEVFADKLKMKEKRTEILLKGFETRAKKERLNAITNEINSILNSIRNNISEYRRLVKLQEDKMLIKDGLTLQIKRGGEESEIIDYFTHNKHLHLVNSYSSQLEFIVNCHLDNYDVEMYERISKNFDSYIYTGYSVTNAKFLIIKDRKLLLDAIFSDEPLLKIKTCGFYRIDLTGWVETEDNYDYPKKYNDMLPNMHLQRHACLGNQRPLIEEAIRAGDIVGAIEQCVCSAKSINVGESATFPYMLEILFSDNVGKVVELPDGSSCTPTEALEWLKAESPVENVEVPE